MKQKKLLSLLMAVLLCFSMALGAFAAPEEENSVPYAIGQEESSSLSGSESGSQKDDVISAIMWLLGSVDLKEIKNALNNINEALGLPRVEDFTDMAAYADALYDKFAELGLSYDNIINAISANDFINWVNSVLFKTDDQPAEEPAEQNEPAQNSDAVSPDTGVSYSAAGAAAVTLLLSLGVVVLIKRRGIYAE